MPSANKEVGAQRKFGNCMMYSYAHENRSCSRKSNPEA